MIFLCLVFFLLGAFKGSRDWQMKSNSGSWEDKYKTPLQIAPDNFYYRFYNLKYKERFPLSATFLVFLTDWWHFFSFAIIVTQLLLVSGLVYGSIEIDLNPLFLVSIIYGCRQLGFHLLYTFILPRL